MFSFKKKVDKMPPEMREVISATILALRDKAQRDGLSVPHPELHLDSYIDGMERAKMDRVGEVRHKALRAEARARLVFAWTACFMVPVFLGTVLTYIVLGRLEVIQAIADLWPVVLPLSGVRIALAFAPRHDGDDE